VFLIGVIGSTTREYISFHTSSFYTNELPFPAGPRPSTSFSCRTDRTFDLDVLMNATKNAAPLFIAELNCALFLPNDFENKEDRVEEPEDGSVEGAGLDCRSWTMYKGVFDEAQDVTDESGEGYESVGR